MALTGYKLITIEVPTNNANAADSATAVTNFNALIAAEIVAGNSPVGPPSVYLSCEWPVMHTVAQGIAVGEATVTHYTLYTSKDISLLGTAVTAGIVDGYKLLGGVICTQFTRDIRHGVFFQAAFKGVLAAGGAGVTAHVHSGADITSGTVPVAQLPVATNVLKGVASFGTGTTVTAGAVTVP